MGFGVVLGEGVGVILLELELGFLELEVGFVGFGLGGAFEVRGGGAFTSRLSPQLIVKDGTGTLIWLGGSGIGEGVVIGLGEGLAFGVETAIEDALIEEGFFDGFGGGGCQGGYSGCPGFLVVAGALAQTVDLYEYVYNDDAGALAQIVDLYEYVGVFGPSPSHDTVYVGVPNEI